MGFNPLVAFWTQVRRWGEFVKFSHTVFALPFAMAAMLVAARDNHGWPGWRTFGLILLAMASARTCAMAFNRIADREFDKANPRTAMRHLPAGASPSTGRPPAVRRWRASSSSAAPFRCRRSSRGATR